MVSRVFHSKVLDFLERVPLGRIINRFANDVYNVDFTTLAELIVFLGYVIAVLLDLVVTVKYTTFASIFLVIIFGIVGIYIQRTYMLAKRELLRMELSTNSPIASLFGEVIKGLPEIRSMRLAGYFKNKLKVALGENLKNNILIFGCDQWFDLRIGFANIIFVQIPCYTYLTYLFCYGECNMTGIAMALIYSTNITADCIDMLTNFSDFESSLISVERCNAFTVIAPEEGYSNFEAEEKKMITLKKSDKVPLKYWKYAPALKLENPHIIKEGRISFDNVSARYNEKADNVLSNLSFEIRPKEKIGIVGRTGAGKSTVTKLFWRCLDYYQGSIKIDGKDIKHCDLKKLRSEMDILTQESPLFNGTLRENLNLRAVKDESDYIMVEILNELGFKSFLEIDLDMKIEANGANLSIGERQIICFCRVLLSKRKLVIMDESTASIDLKSEERIQRTLINSFNDCTMIIIAHRLQTIMHCDRIMVLKNGKIIEFDSPKKLLAKPNGYFKKMYNKNQKFVKSS